MPEFVPEGWSWRRACWLRSRRSRSSAPGERVTAKLAGHWTAEHAAAIERFADEIVAEPDDASHHPRSCRGATGSTPSAPGFSTAPGTNSANGELSADFANADPEQQILLDEVAYRGFQEHEAGQAFAGSSTSWCDVGRSVYRRPATTSSGGVAFLGELISGLVRIVLNPSRFRRDGGRQPARADRL